MAWGYWSAATVSDRARSPRRNTSTSFAHVSSHFASSLPAASIIPPPPPPVSTIYQHRASQHIYGHIQPVQQQSFKSQHPLRQSRQSTYFSQQQQQQQHQQQQHHHHHHHPPPPPPPHHHHPHHHLHHHGSTVGSGSDEEYPPPISTLSRRPSFADIEFTGPLSSGRPISLRFEDLCDTSRPPSALNTYPRSYSHHHSHMNNNNDLRASKRSITIATSTNNLYAPRSSFRKSDCFVHQHSVPPPSVCRIHRKEYNMSDEEDEPDPAYATVFPNEPPAPGMTCQGEDRSIYRRGARRWRKLYRVNGHIFQAKRFNRRAFCAYCHDRIWGLGRQGFKCIQCKLLIHKKCHKLIRKPCSNESVEPIQKDESNGEPSAATTPSPTLPLEGREFGEPLDSNSESVPVEVRNEDNVEHGGQRHYSLNDFELIRVIGRGSYAKVLMVELKSTKRIYAMKVIKKALVTEDEDIDWVQTEKHVFETATNHPFLVGLHSCFQTSSRLFFVIEFVRGGDLMFHMQRQHRLPESHACFYSAEISLALNFLHERGIIYRDLKLDNVLLDHEGHVKLTDYGMCKEGIRAGDVTSTFCGTPNYIAPEILRGEDYGFSVDWWALGVLLFEMLAGRSPFNMVDAPDNPDQYSEDYLFQIILEKPIRVPRSLTVGATAVLKGFLNKNPADRLGYREGGFAEIRQHKFFSNISWEDLAVKAIQPPYQPVTKSDRDLANFPPEFTDEPVHLTPDDRSVIERIDQSEFEGFEYVNPLLMSLEDCV